MTRPHNPFDFSDFQRPHDASPQAGAYGPGASGGGFGSSAAPSAFDPFAASAPSGQAYGAAHSDVPAEPTPFGAASAPFGATSTPFGGESVAPGFADEVARPPVYWFALAAVAAAAGIGLAAIAGGKAALAIAGWACAGPVAIGLLAMFTVSDTKRRAQAFYSQPGWIPAAYWGVMALALAGIVVGALRIADWAGRW